MTGAAPPPINYGVLCRFAGVLEQVVHARRADIDFDEFGFRYREERDIGLAGHRSRLQCLARAGGRPAGCPWAAVRRRRPSNFELRKTGRRRRWCTR